MRPFFPYYGSKWNIARHYPQPARAVVVEPFAGSAAYATFYNARRVELLDVDPIIAGVWSYLIGATADEIAALPEMPEAGDSVDNYTLPQEAKWLIGFWLNRGSAQPKKTRTAYSTRTDRAQLNWGSRAKERICAQLPGIAEWTVREASYSEARADDATWFIDPPYGDKGKFYRCRFSDYAALGEWCRNLPGQVIACEGADATWLPFQPLGNFKTSLGRAAEAVWLSDKRAA